MKLKLNYESFDKGLEKLSEEYKIFAPVVLEYKGTYSDTPSIRYKEVKTFEEMEWTLKSHFSPKEVMLPINEILLYFTQDEYSEANERQDKILIFMRACDINAVKRVDEIYLRNGEEDYYYKRNRDKVKFILVGCKESFRNCFCVSMNSNKTEDYAMALNIREDELYIDIKDDTLNVFEGENTDFEVDYVKENFVKVEIPDNIDPVKISQ
ncbi:MAG: anaerobic sulfite reductase subunit A, partial [Intestinibacter sp.]|nr:anaerobic sulfite reductase subunit A [Intestinibacter sp.]